MRPRPLLDIQLVASQEEVMDRFNTRLKDGSSGLGGHVGKTELSLVLKGEERHTFSPWLSLQAYPWQGGTRLRGRMGPHPKLWTLFVFVYSVWMVVFVSGAVYGYVQMVLGDQPTAFWVALIGAVCQGASCSVDLLGRAKGRQQMHLLRNFIRDTLPEAEIVPETAPRPWENEDVLS